MNHTPPMRTPDSERAMSPPNPEPALASGDAALSPSSRRSLSRERVLDIALWGAQVVLAIVFFLAGVFKASQPIDEIAHDVPWVIIVPVWLVRMIGVAEIAGSIGLLLPAALRVVPALTPLAGVGLTTVMVFATGFHLWRAEWRSIVVTLVLGGMAAFVAWGRGTQVPIGDDDD